MRRSGNGQHNFATRVTFQSLLVSAARVGQGKGLGDDGPQLPGHLTITFPTLEDAREVAARFYGPRATRHLDATVRPELPFYVLGVKPPRDLCWLIVRK